MLYLRPIATPRLYTLIQVSSDLAAIYVEFRWKAIWTRFSFSLCHIHISEAGIN